MVTLIELPKDARKHKMPCGECHLREGETCDICGAYELKSTFLARQELRSMALKGGSLLDVLDDLDELITRRGQ